MISTNKGHVNHTFPGKNTQHFCFGVMEEKMSL